jgi:Transposase, Mutator family
VKSVTRANAGQDAPAGDSGAMPGMMGTGTGELWCSPAVRKLLCTTNSIESLNCQLRKVTKARGHFPNDDAAVKLLWLAIINIEDRGQARPRARRGASRPASARTSPPGLSRASASCAGAKRSTSSTPPTQDGYDRRSSTR